MKRTIFLVCLFYCFFRLPIYESIAAIFWQSASYVCLVLIESILYSQIFKQCINKTFAVLSTKASLETSYLSNAYFYSRFMFQQLE